MYQTQSKKLDEGRCFKIFSEYRILSTGYWKVALLPLSLSGCMGIYEGGFECPPGKGLGCTSISDVNEQVNQGLGIRNQNSNQDEDDLNESENHTSSCMGGSCSQPTSEIWYSPWFDPIRTEKRKVKVNDDSISI